MFTDKKKVGDGSLRDQFTKQLKDELKKSSYDKNESILRDTLKKRLDEGKMFWSTRTS